MDLSDYYQTFSVNNSKLQTRILIKIRKKIKKIIIARMLIIIIINNNRQKKKLFKIQNIMA